ncbi:ribonuclease P protein subunit RPR2 [Sporothrix schenckii 1099-18]|uniref:Ribonuclease P protein subunit RPR2 n=1 Tax=Sporothrix schenckii 1099-18 TaxID=1397361 RepID=A0A0F2M718_SPOSC|nr:ribonuclease P protein subunit RPR2 [Sporothrix schenckii 1099-18]KJR85498.1 ribonuclease P protein subunit RPR2 [Sporothrix schenckii 1099-18]
MAKAKGAAGSAVTNRPAYSRVSFLFQAATLLAGTQSAAPSTEVQAKSNIDDKGDDGQETAPPQLQGMARYLLMQMRSVSRKTNMRLRPAMKHSVCKYCDTLLVEGATCISVVENRSRGGRKPWADVLSVTCTTCGRARRYPVTAPRQPRRPFRADEPDKTKVTDDANGQPATKDVHKVQQQGKAQDKKLAVVSCGKEQPQGTKATATKGQNSNQAPG